MKLTVTRLVIFILIEVLILLIAVAVFAQISFKLPPDPPPQYGPQVVLKILKSEKGKKRAVPEAIVWFSLTPLTGPTAQAPLSPGDYLLCRDFTLTDEAGGLHIAVRCGDDTYLVDAVGLAAPVEEKKR
ncbi:MAG: hypothetical protein ACYDHE_19675 [Candidatus Acidiferrales bacterium]